MTKQIIGMVHFSPLEGDPKFPGEKVVLERAQEDLQTLVAGGVDTVMFENNFDNPKFEKLPALQAQHFEQLVECLTKDLKIPWGISALWNDYELGFRLCKGFGGAMVRVPVFVDSVETVYGKFFADPSKVINARSKLGANHVKILADVQVKHSRMLDPRPLSESVQEAMKSGADAVVITGSWTGDPPTVEMVKEARDAVQAAEIFIGSGMSPENVASFLPYVDGCIVGTAFKAIRENDMSGPNIVGPEVRYDLQHVRDFVCAVKVV